MIICLSLQLRGFFKGMAFPVMTTGLANSVVFGSYSNALNYLTQSQRSDRSQGKPATAAQIFTAGCFSGLVQVRRSLAGFIQSPLQDHFMQILQA